MDQQEQSKLNLTVEEIKQDHDCQSSTVEVFNKEIELLISTKIRSKENSQIYKSSSLYRLHPFLDDNGILRE